MSYTPNDALHVFESPGGPKLIDGVLIESDEWVAALYESSYADQEYAEGPDGRGHDTFTEMDSAGRYADTAQSLAEEIWTRDTFRTTGADEPWLYQSPANHPEA